MVRICCSFASLSASTFFFFNDTATTEIYTLSLHDALSISSAWRCRSRNIAPPACASCSMRWRARRRSEEHTSELQSRPQLVCRLLLEKKKNKTKENLAHKIRQHNTQ